MKQPNLVTTIRSHERVTEERDLKGNLSGPILVVEINLNLTIIIIMK